MSTQERRKREKEQRREMILDAAEQVFFESGIESVRMDDVAVQASVSKGTLYLYFKSKSELALGLHERGMRVLHGKIVKVMSRPGKGIELIHNISKIFFEFAHEHPHYFKLFVYFESVGVDVISEVNETNTMKSCNELGDEMFNFLRRSIQVGIQDGSIDAQIDPDSLAIQMIASVRGLVQMSYFYDHGLFFSPALENLDFSVEKLLQNYIDLVVRAITPR